MAPELSSNWKRLQVTLKDSKKASADRKKKAEPTERQRNSLAKRKRLEAKAALTGSTLTTRRPLPNTKMGYAPSKVEEGGDTAPSATLALWAEDNDISTKDLAEAYGMGMKDTAVNDSSKDEVNAGLATEVEVGKYVAMDCEMVGVGGAEDRSVLARVSIVNFHGTQVYDSFVKPKEFVTDWRTHVSGVSPKNMATARLFDVVQQEVGELLQDRILVGHAIKNDLDAMMLGHPKKDIRDTSRFSGFRKYSAGRTPSLKKLAKEVLGVDIQGGEHSSIEDARATMLLFRRHKSAFDIEYANRYPPRTGQVTTGRSKPRKKKAKN